MSTEIKDKLCRNLVANLEGDLLPWYQQLVNLKVDSNILRLNLTEDQLILCASMWPKKENIIIISKPGEAQPDQFVNKIKSLCRLINVSNNWHLINSALTVQESSGLIGSELSRSYHHLLGQDAANFVVTSDALEQPLPPTQEYASAGIKLTSGEKITPQILARRLTAAGYLRHQKSIEPGGFIVRGENIVISDPVRNQKINLSFYHQTLEQITISLERRLKRSQPISSLTLSPLIFPKPSLSWSNFLQRYVVFRPRHEDELSGHSTIIYDSLLAQIDFPFAADRSPTQSLKSGRQNFVFFQNHDRTNQFLSHHKISARLIPAHLATFPFHLSSLTTSLISETSLFPYTSPSQPISYRRQLGLIKELTPGQMAVHSDHGIGIYEGLQQKEYQGYPRDYLMLRYAAGDILAVPVEYAHKVTAYVGQSQPTIHRLNTAAWSRAKRQAKESAIAFARELLAVASRRQQHTRIPITIDSSLEQELNASFPFPLTTDQQLAWEDVKSDLTSKRSMDRLIVGDVGFGKTEIAVRACAQVAAAGKQVAILAPTTLLVQQHYDIFSERLSAVRPVLAQSLAVLSRFSSPAKIKETKALIANGQVRIVIGTHSLLDGSLPWPNLGLVIIDEEQRFGVGQKELFKKIRSTVDLLSLSATPIPRTLSMALSDLKQLSVISTAPAGRQDIKTYVAPDTDEIIRAAITPETARGGQVYLVAPRVRSLTGLARRVGSLFPNLSIAVVHGSLPPRILATTIKKFDSGGIDILVASSIVEHGLDLPNANTIIVTSCTHFGLADLYQLRGRIGRRDKAGRAFFLYNQGRLTTQQKERLSALTEASRLGSGWSLARRDLEIRGAGNLLGAEQSGSVNEVGVQLYLDLVRDAADRSGALNYQDVEIHLPISALIPPAYIADADRRAQTYQSLSRSSNLEKLRLEVSRLIATFGALPPQSKNLIMLLKLQHVCAHLNIRSIQSQRIQALHETPVIRVHLDTSQTAPKIISALIKTGRWQSQLNRLTKDFATLDYPQIKQIYKDLTQFK